MKITFLFLIITFNVFSQNLPDLTKEGFEPIIVDVENMSDTLIYQKTKEWIQINYENPTEVLKADIENKLIRINGFAINGFETKSIGIISKLDYSYTIEIEFKENKYRYSYIINQFFAGNKPAVYSFKYFFKANGTVKNSQKHCIETLYENANKTSLSLYNYITEKADSKKNDW
jgi:hypothetical protein